MRKSSFKKCIAAVDVWIDSTTREVNPSFPEAVIAKGYGLSSGFSGQPNVFTLDAQSAGVGDFDVVIKGASRATIEYIEESEALYKVKYHVSQAGDYQIEIKYDEKHITGSPFVAKILDSSLNEHRFSKRYDSISKDTTSWESFPSLGDTSEEDNPRNFDKLPFDIKINTPSDKVIEGSIYKKRDGKLAIKFPREEIGKYTVNMLDKTTGNHITGSPYEVEITAKPEEDEHTEGKRKPDKIMTKKSKIGDLDCFSIFGLDKNSIEDIIVAVVGPASIKLRVFQTNLNVIDILYDIKIKGKYVFHVHHKGLNICGSPFDVLFPLEKNSLLKKTLLAPLAPHSVTVWHGFDARYQHFQTQLTDKSGSNISHNVVRKGEYLFDIRFLPNHTGIYNFGISFGDETVDTFQIKINEYKEGKDIVRISGKGLRTSYINETELIKIESDNIFCESFSIEFDGPGNVEINQHYIDSKHLDIEYKGCIVGQYSLSIKYDGFHVGQSPYQINLISRSFEQLAIEFSNSETIKSYPNMCKAYGPGLSKAICGKTSCFTVDALNAGSGSLMAGFDSGNRNSLLTEVICKHIGHCVYNVQYKIDYPGQYKLSVLWAAEHIPGSPFIVLVNNENNIQHKADVKSTSVQC